MESWPDLLTLRALHAIDDTYSHSAAGHVEHRAAAPGCFQGEALVLGNAHTRKRPQTFRAFILAFPFNCEHRTCDHPPKWTKASFKCHLKYTRFF
eukprot:1159278-Pelagomonas_calceolata.AAC.5